MAGGRPPGAQGAQPGAQSIDAGTMVRDRSPTPGPVGPTTHLGQQQQSPQGTSANMSDTVRDGADSAVGTIAQLTYDSFIRQYIYEPAAQAFSKSGDRFVELGLMTRQEAAQWVVAQRNAFLIAVRDERNSPLGRALSEYLKPRDRLPQFDDLVAKYASRTPEATSEQIFEAIIKSGARTRASVNRVAVALRWAGPVLIVVNISLSAYIIEAAPRNQRGRVAAGEAGALLGGLGGGWAGAKIGCTAGAGVGVWFEGVGAIPGCAIGAFIGAAGLGWAGAEAGHYVGGVAWDAANTIIEWRTDRAGSAH